MIPFKFTSISFIIGSFNFPASSNSSPNKSSHLFVPAFAHTTTIAPNFSYAVSKRDRTEDQSETSVLWNKARGEERRGEDAGGGCMSAMIMFAPWVWARVDVARPMPEAPPVMRMVLSFREDNSESVRGGRVVMVDEGGVGLGV